MVFHHESARDNSSSRQMQRTNTQIKDITAFPALKMVVMTKIGRFVARLAIRQVHALDLLGIQ